METMELAVILMALAAALRNRVGASSRHDAAGIYGENAPEPGRCRQMRGGPLRTVIPRWLTGLSGS
jgi:DMSO/TMAO reductase YedYZ molybdopterin-dependent catalytic subunit